MKNLYLHIGAHKTGTSAIQTFLALNRNYLKGKKICYPGNKDVHHDIVKTFNNSAISGSNTKFIMDQYINQIKKSNCKTVIFSSEGFIKLAYDDILALKNYLNNFETKIVYYVRRQDERLESGYNQIIREKDRRYTNKISINFIHSKRSHRLDYYHLLSSWREIFGQENIIVRVYENEQLQDGIFQDFLNILGLELDDNFLLPGNEVNKSFNWDIIEIIRLCNSHFKDDFKFHLFLIKSLENVNLGKNGKKQYLLSPQQRREVIAHYADSNAKVAREYLGREDGRLFYAPLPDLDEPWEPYEGLTVEKCVPIFMQMLYNMDQKYQRKMQNTLIKQKRKKI